MVLVLVSTVVCMKFSSEETIEIMSPHDFAVSCEIPPKYIGCCYWRRQSCKRRYREYCRDVDWRSFHCRFAEWFNDFECEHLLAASLYGVNGVISCWLRSVKENRFLAIPIHYAILIKLIKAV